MYTWCAGLAGFAAYVNQGTLLEQRGYTLAISL